jgi:hypothetical protein
MLRIGEVLGLDLDLKADYHYSGLAKQILGWSIKLGHCHSLPR